MKNKVLLTLLIVSLSLTAVSAKKITKKKRRKQVPKTHVPANSSTPKKKISRKSRARRAKALAQTASLRSGYRELRDHLQPQKKFSPLSYQLARLSSGLVPFGLAGAGGYQALNNNKLIGGGLMLSSIAASILRTRMLRAMMRRGSVSYHEALYKYLEDWPQQREHTPEAVRGVIDRIHEEVSQDPSVTVTPEHARALSDAIQAVGLIDNVQHKHTETESDKWEFVLMQLGLMGDKKQAYAQLFAQRLAKYISYQMLGILAGLAGGAYLGARIAPFRRYVLGSKASPIDLAMTKEDDRVKRARVEQYQIRQEWPARLLGWHNDSGIRWRIAVSFLGIPIVLMPLIGFIVSSVALNRSVNKANNALFDIFMTAWPSMKAHTPRSLHERFDHLYEKRFDTTTNRLMLEDVKRKAFLKNVLKEGQTYRSKALEKRRSVAPKKSFLARLFGRKG